MCCKSFVLDFLALFYRGIYLIIKNKHENVSLHNVCVKCYSAKFAGAQTTADKIEGTWNGTSICQQKQFTCHAENVVYHTSKKSATLYTMQASKIVDGVEKNIGTFDSDVYNATKQTLSFTMKDNQGRKAVWLFKLDDTQMHGILT